MFILTFFGEYRGKIEHYEHAQEVSKTINLTLACLSFGSIIVGVLFFDFFLGDQAELFFSKSLFINQSNHILHDLHNIPTWVKISPFIAMLSGFLIACLCFSWKPKYSSSIAENQKILYNFLLKKWYFDEIYDYSIVRPARWFGAKFWKVGDQQIIDGLINSIALNFFPKLTHFAGRLQSGYIFHYAFAIFIGLVSFLTYFLISFGN